MIQSYFPCTIRVGHFTLSILFRLSKRWFISLLAKQPQRSFTRLYKLLKGASKTSKKAWRTVASQTAGPVPILLPKRIKSNPSRQSKTLTESSYIIWCLGLSQNESQIEQPGYSMIANPMLHCRATSATKEKDVQMSYPFAWKQSSTGLRQTSLRTTGTLKSERGLEGEQQG